MTDMLGPYQLNTIVTGDARELSKAIPDKSVDLIFTDPIYQNLDDYWWLVRTVCRVLKTNRACLVFVGIGYLPETLDALYEGGLVYRWYVPHLTPGTSGYCDTGPSRQMAMLWLDNSSETCPKPRLYDVVFTNGVVDWHVWRKNLAGILRWLNSFSGIVIDFFCGGGTAPAACKMLGRHYLAFEIDPKTAEIARQRVA